MRRTQSRPAGFCGDGSNSSSSTVFSAATRRTVRRNLSGLQDMPPGRFSMRPSSWPTASSLRQEHPCGVVVSIRSRRLRKSRGVPRPGSRRSDLALQPRQDGAACDWRPETCFRGLQHIRLRAIRRSVVDRCPAPRLRPAHSRSDGLSRRHSGLVPAFRPARVAPALVFQIHRTPANPRLQRWPTDLARLGRPIGIGGRAGGLTPATPHLSRSFERSWGDFGAGGGRKLA